RPSTTDWYLQRITPHRARAFLLRDTRPQGPSAPSQHEWFEKRYSTIIELVCRDLARAPNLHVKKYMVDSLYDHFVLKEQNWDRLRETLLDQPDPAVRVYVARSLLEDVYPANPLFEGRSHAARALLAAEPTREKLLVAVLADGLSQKQKFIMMFTSGYEPVAVAGIAMYALQNVVPRQNLAAAVSGLITELQHCSSEGWWREAARDLLIGYVGQDRARAREIIEATAPGTAEALAVCDHCRKLLT
ncbi:MAG TPA: hypothetical protein VFV34_12055, partial [Blastocatellia bacterium]|nr:hypothetical protein [Blastocatellia bacterium]